MGGGAVPARSGPRAAVGNAVVATGCALLGAALWGSALAWRTPGYPVPGGSLADPYTSTRMIGWAVAVLLTATLLSLRWNPVAVGLGVAGGTWLAFTTWAALYPDAGATWAVTPLLLVAPLGIGVTLAAAAGHLLRRWTAPRADRRR